jgi:hypothetical protein
VRFQLDIGGTLANATAWAAMTAYALGAVRSNAGHVYYALAAGTSGSSGPTTTPTYPATITDGTVTWGFLGNGTAYLAAASTCTVSGPISAPAFVLTAIGTPVTGVSNVANPQDMLVGNATETDEALRLRRQVELHGLSTSPLESVRAAIEELADVTSVTVFENTTDLTNADGMPPHSVEAVVTGGTGTEIRSTLFGNVAAGIQTYGNTSGTVTDSMGQVHTIKYTVPTELDVYLAIVLTVDDDHFPADGATTALDGLLAYGQRQLVVGYDVEPTALIGSLFTLGMRGLLRVDVQDDISPITLSTPSQTISVGPRQIARLDSSRTAITVVGKIP